MLRPIFITAALIVALPSSSALAVTAKEKAATCKFGADSQKLAGKARTAFMTKCMFNKNDPRGSATAPAAPGGGGVPPPPGR